MKELSADTAAYCAGLFDGEGCVDIHYFLERRGRSDKRRSVFRVSVTNTNRNVLVWLKSILGGSICRKNPGKKNWKPSYNWYLCGLAAASFLHSIRPYSKIKTEVIDVGISFATTLKDRSKNEYLSESEKVLRASLIVEAKRLNRRGNLESA